MDDWKRECKKVENAELLRETLCVWNKNISPGTKFSTFTFVDNYSYVIAVIVFGSETKNLQLMYKKLGNNSGK
jgi:hypothetical protein